MAYVQLKSKHLRVIQYIMFASNLNEIGAIAQLSIWWKLKPMRKNKLPEIKIMEIFTIESDLSEILCVLCHIVTVERRRLVHTASDMWLALVVIISLLLVGFNQTDNNNFVSKTLMLNFITLIIQMLSL